MNASGNEIILEDDLLTAKEVVEKLFHNRISYRQLLQLSHEGAIPCMMLKKSYYYSATAVRMWLNKNLQTPAWTKVKA